MAAARNRTSAWTPILAFTLIIVTITCLPFCPNHLTLYTHITSHPNLVKLWETGMICTFFILELQNWILLMKLTWILKSCVSLF